MSHPVAVRPNTIPLSRKVPATPQLQSPVGEGLTGLRYIDDVGSRDDMLKFASSDQLDLKLNPDEEDYVSPDEDEHHVQNSAVLSALTYPSEIEALIDTGQVVVHLGNLRMARKVDQEAVKLMEVIDETRRVLFHVEQDEHDLATSTAFRYQLYDRYDRPAIQVYSPRSSTLVCCGASWHSLKCCRFEAIVYSPPGTVAGFVRRSRTKFIQEFQILNANEQLLLVLRGGPQDMEILGTDHENVLGRLSVHGWVGIMHEIRRTNGDYGMTFPIDLDVRVKAILIGAIFAIHWLYSTRGGKKK